MDTNRAINQLKHIAKWKKSNGTHRILPQDATKNVV
jgi:hypothetical protein